jgi:hypothetical protein
MFWGWWIFRYKLGYLDCEQEMKTPEEMATFTITDIRSWKPCYDPCRHLPEDWSGTVIDLLNIESIPVEDRLWIVLRQELIDAKTLRLFAVWCARQVQHLITNESNINAIQVAERFALGNATASEMAAARDAAENAAWAAAGDAAGDAARAAARNAARNAAWAAAKNAAWAAAWDAAGDAARNAAWAAAWDAAGAAAWDAAGDAARHKQIKHLIKMLEEK